MISIQGFVEIAQYVNNTPGVIGSFGELSPYSRTYSKEKGLYQNSSIPGYSLVTFRSLNEQGQMVAVPSDQVLEILEVTRAIVAYAQGHTRPYDEEDFIDTIRSQFATTVNGLGFGEFVHGTSISLPSFVVWTSINTGNSMRIWLADEAFQSQFTGFEITIIPPLDNLNNFFLPYTEAKAMLDSTSISVFMEKIQTAKNKYPDTITHILEFDFYNRYDQTVKTPCKFGILIYGLEGDYVDAIKDAIIEHLLQNSSYTEEQWKSILPDIFKRTEMMIVPRWDTLAIENLTEQASLYSSLVNPYTNHVFVRNFLGTIPDVWLQGNMYTLPFPLKTLMSFVVNGSNNEPGKTDFKTMYPDYLPIPSTSLDFARMSIPTQQWVLFIDDVLLEAERVTALSTLPSGMRRVFRNNKIFVAKIHNGVNYLVAAKINSEFQ